MAWSIFSGSSGQEQVAAIDRRPVLDGLQHRQPAHSWGRTKTSAVFSAWKTPSRVTSMWKGPFLTR